MLILIPHAQAAAQLRQALSRPAWQEAACVSFVTAIRPHYSQEWSRRLAPQLALIRSGDCDPSVRLDWERAAHSPAKGSKSAAERSEYVPLMTGVVDVIL